MKMNEFHTCIELIEYIGKSYSNPKALNYRDKNEWHGISTEKFIESIKHLVLGLHQLGLQREDRVGILAYPSPKWTIADLAIIIAGGVSVPLFANISEENFIYEISETGLKIIFVEGKEQWDVWMKHQERFDVAIAMSDHPPHSKIIGFKEILDQGKILEMRRPHLYDRLKETGKREDLGAIIYTSGSTGTPKGVELNQANLMAAVHFDQFNLDPKKDSYLSVLPLAHVFGHCINFWALAWGVSIYYFNDYKKLGIACREVQPTTMVVVPRLLEKVYDTMLENAQEAPWFHRMIGKWAFNLANLEGRSRYKQCFRGIADRLVFSKLRHGLGGKLRVVLSGGAPLNVHLHHFFQEIGIPIYEGWGLTEACPVCVNIPDRNKIGTVGPPMVGHQILISPEKEVLVKGSLVMRGYYCHPEGTAQAIDGEGWLHTGDRGELDGDGYLTLQGRMKELYKTSTGEYVAPIPIEQAFTRFPFIDMAMVLAEGRKFTSCLLFPNTEVLKRMKMNRGEEKMSDQEFLHSSFICNKMIKVIDGINAHLNHWEQVHKYRFILEPLTIEGGELTPSMKIRRDIVAQKYKHVIDGIYHEEVA